MSMSRIEPKIGITNGTGSSPNTGGRRSSQQGHQEPPKDAGIDPRQLTRRNPAVLSVNTSTMSSPPNPLPTPSLSPSTSHYTPSHGFSQLGQLVSQSQALNSNNHDLRLQHPDQRSPFYQSQSMQSGGMSLSASQHPPSQYQAQQQQQQSPYHSQRDQNMQTHEQPHTTDSISACKQPVHIPPQIKAAVQNAVLRATPLVTSAWNTTISQVEIAMAQVSASYENSLNVEIAKRKGFERGFHEAIEERDTGRKELQKLWDENQKLLQDMMQFQSHNGSMQTRCAELEMDKKALTVFVEKLSRENASLTQEIQNFREGRNVEASNAGEIAETVKGVLTEQYQTSIGGLLADAQEQRSLRLEAERKLAEFERQAPSTPTRSAMLHKDRYPTPTSPSVPFPQTPNTNRTTNPVASSALVTVDEIETAAPFATSSHDKESELPERNDYVDESTGRSSTSKTTGTEITTDRKEEWETQGDTKRRRLDGTAITEEVTGPCSDAGEAMDTATKGGVEVSSADLPVWRVKVEESPTEKECDKLTDGDNIDELRDEDISRTLKEPSTCALDPIPLISGSSPTTNAHTHPTAPTSFMINANHLQYIYHEVNNRLVCVFCSNRYSNADPQTVWPPITSFPKEASIQGLMAHSRNSHASACANLAKMSKTQLEKLKARQVNTRAVAP